MRQLPEVQFEGPREMLCPTSCVHNKWVKSE